MSDPISRIYNLGRLGQAVEEVAIVTTPEERAALAALARLPRIERFSGQVVLRKISASHFALDFTLEAKLVQACVVSLAEVPAEISKSFARELHFTPSLRRSEAEITITPEEDDQPEEIDSLHFDLGGPLTEEFLLALDPYPRAPGVEFTPPEGMADKPPSPFAALKGLKSRL